MKKGEEGREEEWVYHDRELLVGVGGIGSEGMGGGWVRRVMMMMRFFTGAAAIRLRNKQRQPRWVEESLRTGDKDQRQG